MIIHNVYSGKVASSVMASGAPNDHTRFGSRGKPENILSICEDCNSTNLERDAHTNELTCIDCGLVIEDLVYSGEPIYQDETESTKIPIGKVSKTNRELGWKLKKYERFNQTKESVTVKIIRLELKNQISSKQNLDTAIELLNEIRNTTTKLGKRSLHGYSPELTSIVVIVILKWHIQGNSFNRTSIINEIKNLSKEKNSKWYHENIPDFSSLKDCTKKIFNIYYSNKNEWAKQKDLPTEVRKKYGSQDMEFNRHLALKSIIEDLKRNTSLAADFQLDKSRLLAELNRSNRYPYLGKPLYTFTCETVYQICRNRQIGLTREKIVQCCTYLDDNTKIDSWSKEIKSIIGDETYE